MYLISGHIQHYAWGIKGGLSRWHLGVDPNDQTPDARPDAELWFGAHSNGPSPMLGQPDLTLLDCVDPGDIPLLVKLLAAAKPLSLQIHPPARQAEASFAEQQHDPSLPKLLADSLPKTEMLIALQPFSVLYGLRDSQRAAAILDAVGGPAVAAADLVRAGDPKAAIRELLAISTAQLAELTPRVPASGQQAGLDQSAVEALSMIEKDYPCDPGVLVSTMLNHRLLETGEALYVPVGIVHAYVQGVGVEVMTSSDNVLRLGLTPKTVAVDHALDALDTDPDAELMGSTEVALPGGGTVRRYEPAGAPFAVEWIRDGSLAVPTGRYRLVLVISGEVRLRTGDQIVTMVRGEAAAILANEPTFEIQASGSTFVATDAS